MKRLILLSGTMLGLVLAGRGAALRRQAPVAVAEGASVEIDAGQAVALRSSNTAVASVTPPDGGRATVTGLAIGTAELTSVDVRGPFAVTPVTVVPGYWDTLRQFFEDDPEITVSIGGSKVIVSGKTSNPETLRRVERSKAFDPARIISQVTFSVPSIATMLGGYLVHVGYSNITASAVGNEICLAGRLYDRPAIATVEKRAKEFLTDFPGVGLNVDALQVFRQKIVLELELLEYDVNEARNLGIEWPSAIALSGQAEYGWDWSRKTTDTDTANRSGSANANGDLNRNSTYTTTEAKGSEPSWNRSTTETSTGTRTSASSLSDTLNSVLSKANGQTAKASAQIAGLNATINLLKQNGVSKTLYKTSLATQSGEEAKFQNGGTIHRNTQGTFTTGDLKTIEYGFIIKAKPVIIDGRTVLLELDLDNKTPLNYDASRGVQTQDIDVSRYQTKSKYMVSPGETIVMSGFNKLDEQQKRSGLPWLCKIPFIGEWLFGNTYTANSTKEMLLVVKIDWVVDDGSAEAIRRRDEIKARKAETEMP